MNAFVACGFAFIAVLAACFLVLWYGSAAVIDEHDGRIGALEQKWAENFGGPEPVAVSEPGNEADTEEFEIAPATVPDGMPLAVQSALIEQPHPVDSDETKAKRAAWVEEQMAKMDFSGRRK